VVPKDVLDAITMQLGGETYDCAEAHMLAFQIGIVFWKMLYFGYLILLLRNQGTINKCWVAGDKHQPYLAH
jgi:hypothetical protein